MAFSTNLSASFLLFVSLLVFHYSFVAAFARLSLRACFVPLRAACATPYAATNFADILHDYCGRQLG
jgi:hypothetical protein